MHRDDPHIPMLERPHSSHLAGLDLPLSICSLSQSLLSHGSGTHDNARPLEHAEQTACVRIQTVSRLSNRDDANGLWAGTQVVVVGQPQSQWLDHLIS